MLGENSGLIIVAFVLITYKKSIINNSLVQFVMVFFFKIASKTCFSQMILLEGYLTFFQFLSLPSCNEMLMYFIYKVFSLVLGTVHVLIKIYDALKVQTIVDPFIFECM